MSKTIRLTTAQALVRYMAAQLNEDSEPFIAGVWGIFGHGNVAAVGEALYAQRDTVQTWRGHNEQTMAHTAIAYAKQLRRKRAMAVTSSIGPGATNMVTAAALAHANRLPVLLLPGDIFASRGPDPVLQQIEDFGDGTVSANDCFRPVSRYFDRITRPEQLMTALPRAFATMTDPADCGPVTLALCQDVQAEAWDFPEQFFKPKHWLRRRPGPDNRELETAVAMIRSAKKPLIIAGGGVHYADACDTLKTFIEKHQIPVSETQAGKSVLPFDHPLNLGSVGVTGGEAANTVAREADLVIGIGTRFQDFTTGSWKIFQNPDHRILAINVAAYDGFKHNANPLIADAAVALDAISASLGNYQADTPAATAKSKWIDAIDAVTATPKENNALPTDMQVIGAVQRVADKNTVIMSAAGTMPGELHKLWKAGSPMSYHTEYGFSCMGYEIAGALGIKMAEPDRDVICMVGDGSYLMANSELATAVMMGKKITLVITDNRGFGCINRLQMGTGGAEFNNLLDSSYHEVSSSIDFVAHAASLGAKAVKADSVAELETALTEAKAATQCTVVVIDTDPYPSTEAGGAWWDVAVPEVSEREDVRSKRTDYETQISERDKNWGG